LLQYSAISRNSEVWALLEPGAEVRVDPAEKTDAPVAWLHALKKPGGRIFFCVASDVGHTNRTVGGKRGHYNHKVETFFCEVRGVKMKIFLHFCDKGENNCIMLLYGEFSCLSQHGKKQGENNNNQPLETFRLKLERKGSRELREPEQESATAVTKESKQRKRERESDRADWLKETLLNVIDDLELYGRVHDAKLKRIKESLQDENRKNGDIAYWTLKLDAEEMFHAGEVVALLSTSRGLRVSKAPSNADNVFAWTVVADREGVTGGPRPILIGNPEGGKISEDSFVLVVYMGHVKVWVEGEIISGDVLFAPQISNGKAVCAKVALNPRRRIGVALSDRNKEDQSVIAFVWLMQGGPQHSSELMSLPSDVKELSLHLQGQEEAIAFNAQSLKELMFRVDTLEVRFEDLEKKVASLSVGSSVVNSKEFLNEVIKYCTEFCQVKLEEDSWLVLSLNDARLQSEQSKLRRDAILGWKSKLDIMSNREVEQGVLMLQDSSKDDSLWIKAAEITMSALAKAEAEISSWAQVVVMLDLKERLKKTYSSFKLKLFDNPNGRLTSMSFDESYLGRELHIMRPDGGSSAKIGDLDLLQYRGTRIALAGKAGLGKSMLCRWMCYQWAKDEQEWDIAVFFTFEEVRDIIVGADQSMPLNRRLSWPDLFAAKFFSMDAQKQEKANLFWEWVKRAQSRVLWVFDGYDKDLVQKSPLLKEWFCGNGNSFVDSGRQSMIIATKPDFLSCFKWGERIDLSHFSRADVFAFIALYFGRSREQILSFDTSTTSHMEEHLCNMLLANDLLMKDAQTPLILDLLCFAVKDQKERFVFDVEPNVEKVMAAMHRKTTAESACEIDVPEDRSNSRRFYQLTYVFGSIIDSVVKKVSGDDVETEFLSDKLDQTRSVLAKLAFESFKKRSLEQAVSLADRDIVVKSSLLKDCGKGLVLWNVTCLRNYLAAEWIVAKLPAKVLASIVLNESNKEEEERDPFTRQLYFPVIKMESERFPDIASFICMIALSEFSLHQDDVSNKTYRKIIEFVTLLLNEKFWSGDKGCHRAIARCVMIDQTRELFSLAKETWGKVWDGQFWVNDVAAVGDKDMLKVMFDSGVSPDDAVREAGLNNHFFLVVWLVLDMKADPSYCMDHVVCSGHASFYKLLLELGADPNESFHIAVIEDQIGIVKVALEYKRLDCNSFQYKSLLKMETVTNAVSKIYDPDCDNEMVELLLDFIASAPAKSRSLFPMVESCVAEWTGREGKVALVKKLGAWMEDYFLVRKMLGQPPSPEIDKNSSYMTATMITEMLVAQLNAPTDEVIKK
jgi:hypothetical protein